MPLVAKRLKDELLGLVSEGHITLVPSGETPLILNRPRGL